MTLLELGNLTPVVLLDLLNLLLNSLINGVLETGSATLVALVLEYLILVLQLLLDSNKAYVDLSLQVLDGLLRVSHQETALFFMLGLGHQQILVTEGVPPELELEEGLVALDGLHF